MSPCSRKCLIHQSPWWIFSYILLKNTYKAAHPSPLSSPKSQIKVLQVWVFVPWSTNSGGGRAGGKGEWHMGEAASRHSVVRSPRFIFRFSRAHAVLVSRPYQAKMKRMLARKRTWRLNNRLSCKAALHCFENKRVLWTMCLLRLQCGSGRFSSTRNFLGPGDRVSRLSSRGLSG